MSAQQELRWTTPGRRIMVGDKSVTWVLRKIGEGTHVLEVRGLEEAGFICEIPTDENVDYFFQSGGRFKTTGRFFVGYQVVKDAEKPLCLKVVEQMGGQSIAEVSLCQVLTVLAQHIESGCNGDILTMKEGTTNRFFLWVSGKPVLVSLRKGSCFWVMYFMWQNLDLLALAPGDRIFYQVWP